MGSAGSSHKAENAALDARQGDDFAGKDVDELAKMAYAKAESGEYRETVMPPSLSQSIDTNLDDMFEKMERIIRDPRDLEDFTEFLVKQYAEESLQFYLALEEFSKRYPVDPYVILVASPGGADGEAAPPPPADADRDARQDEAARAIYAEFVAPGAPKQINVSGKIQRDVKKKLGEGKCDARVFSQAVTSVLQALTKDKLMTFTREQKGNKQIWIRTLRAMDKHRKSVSASFRRRQSIGAALGLADGGARVGSEGNLRVPTAECVKRLSMDVSRVVGGLVQQEKIRRRSMVQHGDLQPPGPTTA
jgi:hypothetical protein